MISVIIPVYNESNISKNIILLLNALSIGKHELIIVNDGSTDNSLQHINETTKSRKNVKLISYRFNRGRGYALRQGFAAAKGDIIVTTESDLTWGSKIVEKLVFALKKSGADLVIASPYLRGGKLVNVPLFRKLLSKLGNIVLSSSLRGNLTMVSGMTRAYKREVIEDLDLESDDKEIHLEILSKAFALGYKAVEIPATLRWEPSRKRKSSFKATKFISTHLLFSINETPFLFIGTIALICIFFGLIGSLFVINFWLTNTLKDHIFVSISSIVILLIGFQILIFSFLANQNRDIKRHLVRLSREIKKK